MAVDTKTKLLVLYHRAVEHLSIKEIAERYGLHRNTVSSLCKNNRLGEDEIVSTLTAILEKAYQESPLHLARKVKPADYEEIRRVCEEYFAWLGAEQLTEGRMEYHYLYDIYTGKAQYRKNPISFSCFYRYARGIYSRTIQSIPDKTEDDIDD